MTRWIVDTNIISETRNPKPNPNVIEWIGTTPPTLLFTTEVTIAEILFGIEMQPDFFKAKSLAKWLEANVRPLFYGRILAINELILLRWWIISRKLQIARQPTPPGDLLIAAIAIENSCFVATRDVAPFVACGIPTLNAFTGEHFNGA